MSSYNYTACTQSASNCYRQNDSKTLPKHFLHRQYPCTMRNAWRKWLVYWKTLSTGLPVLFWKCTISITPRWDDRFIMTCSRIITWRISIIRALAYAVKMNQKLDSFDDSSKKQWLDGCWYPGNTSNLNSTPSLRKILIGFLRKLFYCRKSSILWLGKTRLLQASQSICIFQRDQWNSVDVT